MDRTPAALYLEDVANQFHVYKGLADRALAQVRDEDLFVALDPESNSLAVLIQHMAGNLISRWTDFLTTDGEKPDRDRDSEFETKDGTTREALLARWEEGWRRLFEALAGLTEEDLTRTVTIRAEPHTVIRAIDRQLAHQVYHTGQIVFLAKHLASDHWQNLSVPRGKTRELNADMFARAENSRERRRSDAVPVPRGARTNWTALQFLLKSSDGSKALKLYLPRRRSILERAGGGGPYPDQGLPPVVI